ncbi:MAG: hypothetical protein MJB14_11575, partial [Spirochaetes bacterium]|nr:hypothetical protein [Spirochaetota bacterium]
MRGVYYQQISQLIDFNIIRMVYIMIICVLTTLLAKLYFLHTSKEKALLYIPCTIIVLTGIINIILYNFFNHKNLFLISQFTYTTWFVGFLIYKKKKKKLYRY